MLIMSKDLPQDTPHPNEPLLEALLQNQDKHLSSHEQVLEANLQKLGDIDLTLESQLVEQNKTTKAVEDLTKKLEPKELGDGASFVVKGIKGDKGEDGKDGVDGKDGKDGNDGATGQDGKDGEKGLDGKNGINGRDGLDGRDGIDGKDGKDGADGKDAKEITTAQLKKVIEPMLPKIKESNGLSSLVFGKEEKQITVSETAPPNPYFGQLWYDIS